MQETTYHERSTDLEGVSTDEPAIGLVARPSNSAAIPAAIARARRHGYEPVVTAVDETVEGLQLASELDVLTVDPRAGTPDQRDPWRRLANAARSSGFPGLIAHEDPDERIDYDRSHRDVLRGDQYLVDAATESVVETDAHVLAAIPAYDEASTIEAVVTSTLEYADDVLVVDDGSSDRTASIARDAGATVVEHAENRGYGGSLRTIFAEAERSLVDHLVVLDGDGQHDPADITTLVESQRDTDAPVVIGSRFAAGSDTSLPLYRRFGLCIVNVLTNLSMGVVRRRSWVGDTQSGFRAYDRRAIESLAVDDSIGDAMGASTDILHHAYRNGYAIEEVGTTIDYDVEDASSQNPVSHGIHLVMNILRTIEERRPISSMGIPGLVSSLVGVGVAYLAMANYVDTGTFPLGIALLSVFFSLAGIFACFTSIVLHSLNTHAT